MRRLYSLTMPFPATTPTAGCRVCTPRSDWLAALVHLDTAVCVCYFFSLLPLSPLHRLHIHQRAHEY